MLEKAAIFLINKYTFAFIAGVLSFFSPCILSLLPVYLSVIIPHYFTTKDNETKYNKIITQNELHLRYILWGKMLFFSLGFALIFSFLGLLSSNVGQLMVQQRWLVNKLGGILIIFFGLHLLGVVFLPFFYRSISLPFPITGYNILQSFLLGIVAATAWTPCTGPFLASVMVTAATEANVIKGTVLLFIFALGMLLPLIITGLFLFRSQKLIFFIRQKTKILQTTGGLLLIITGLLIFTGKL